MSSNPKIACVIPARLQSSRFPRKILIDILDKPMMQWVWEAANSTKLFDSVTFAIDSHEAIEIIEGFGGKYIMTSETCANGTERIIEVLNSGKVTADVWVNWQCDEPFITKKMIEQLLQTAHLKDADVWTLKKQIEKFEEIDSLQIAKLVCDSENYALYFSRSRIPQIRDEKDKNEDFMKNLYFKHVGIYAYSTEALRKIEKLKNKQCAIEEAEKLEQLKFLYYGLKIKAHTTDQNVFGIDLPEHKLKAEEFANNLIQK
ncbi:TPA: 3-deoxy-manno-octulosonate cytidylyltransferase [Candidatus Dependentiae bacterium]|nr:MAG: 3-deoxy-manno-octulosonate cytidylyltransferase [candidate division TM6 bacterium GW2011_GWE2_31_21]KKP54022.1 MAG: 3-deoxy-manno-octulosonate cytidylyltransferase [candidate division TM6 bacterium GW2011_GWF2_33_332]HBS48396.1 3-deoxy-manno-octulosonate cytidylyltransferase [Candidatus Dependentiae bacterium]HBZ72930.1 3-deoxy-manno-octulosonate cytidylyltransferase [Candidatus Dependentiae bacterium]